MLGAGGCVRVRGFWEKPAAERARAFLGAGFVWNTLVVVARADTLTALGRRHVPDVAACLEALETHVEGPDASSAVSGAYARLRPANFSREVLAREADALVVLRIRGVLWSDWGTPDRVVRTLREVGMSPDWLETWSARSVGPCSESGSNQVTGSRSPVGPPMAFATLSDSR